MIKMKMDDGVIIIPPSNGIHLLAANQYSGLLISCLNSYFGQKKKTICVAVDEEDDVISNKNVSFVYIPADDNIDPWFEFKPKTPMNSELTEFMRVNPEMFISMESIRNDIKSLLTDSGMFRFREILQDGIGSMITIDSLNYDLQTIVSNLHVDHEELNSEQKYMAAYNLLIYLNRSKFTIIYIDFPVTGLISNWLQSKKSTNRLIIVNNERVFSPPAGIYDSMIVPSIADHVTSIEASIEQTGLYSYLFHPVVRDNMQYQTEKNYKFLSQFVDFRTTFSILFTPDTTF